MIFNRIEKDYIIPLTGRRRSAWAPISRNLTTVIGMPGALLSYTDVQVRVITVPVLVKAENISDLQKVKEDMADWLVHDEPKELIFKDEPDRVYYALVDGELELDEIFSTGRGEITFICPDPYKYGPEKVYQTDQDTFIIENEGTAPTKPIFELTCKQPVTFAMVSDGERYNMIGRPADVDEQIVDPKTLLLAENGTTIDEWTPAPPDMEGGSQGTIGYDGAGITAPSYGTGTGYHGPSVFKEVPPTQDFEIELRGQLYTDHVNQTGRFGFFLFDEQMRQIAFMAAVDNSIYVQRKLAEGRIGPYIGDYRNYIVSSRNYQKQWDNFPALLRLTRQGDTYTFYVARVLGDGRHMEPLTASWTVWEDKFRGPLKYVGIFIEKYGNSASPHTNRIDYIKTYALTPQIEDKTPYIAHEGDVITFDHTTNELLLNGEDAKRLKDFGGEYFDLPKGYTALTILPEGAFDTKVRFRPRYR